jgi:transcriptional regulator with XRE-family HTH domain
MLGTVARRKRNENALRRWRRQHGLSQEELGLACGFSDNSSIYLYESGRRPFTYTRLLKISRLTGLTLWELAWPDQRAELAELAAAVPASERIAS